MGARIGYARADTWWRWPHPHSESRSRLDRSEWNSSEGASRNADRQRTPVPQSRAQEVRHIFF